MRLVTTAVAATILLAGGFASAQSVTTIQVTNETADQFDPAVSNGKVAWTDLRSGTADIWVYDIATGIKTQITNEPHNQNLADIDGNIIVYTDDRAGLGADGFPNLDVYEFDLTTSTESPVSTDPERQLNPAIRGNVIAFESLSFAAPHTSNIWIYDRVTHSSKALAGSPNQQVHPSVSGNRVAWEETVGGHHVIMLYDLSSNVMTALTPPGVDSQSPDLDGDLVVYQSNRTGNLDIWAFNLATNTETQLTTETHDQRNAKVSGSEVVWEDFRNGSDWDLYGIDLTTMAEKALATGPSNQFIHDVSGPDLAYTDDAGGNFDIWVLHFTPATTGGDPCDAGSGAPVLFDENFVVESGHAEHHHGGHDELHRAFSAPSGMPAGTMCVGVEGDVVATIELNESAVFGPIDFAHGVTSLEKDVALLTHNSLEVTAHTRHHHCEDREEGDDDQGGCSGGGDGEHHRHYREGHGGDGHHHGDDGDDGDDDDGAENCDDSMTPTALRIRVVGPTPAPAMAIMPGMAVSCSAAPIHADSSRSMLASMLLLGVALVWRRVRR